MLWTFDGALDLAVDGRGQRVATRRGTPLPTGASHAFEAVQQGLPVPHTPRTTDDRRRRRVGLAGRRIEPQSRNAGGAPLPAIMAFVRSSLISIAAFHVAM